MFLVSGVLYRKTMSFLTRKLRQRNLTDFPETQMLKLHLKSLMIQIGEISKQTVND